ncbi:hypothetical protein [Winogradskyella sp.]|uniref:hypothetical protein n=1 Tax=Winogradskyella sp. TaxID=1883156 RepID=UPI003F69DEEB
MEKTITIGEMRSIVASPFFEEMVNESKQMNVNGNMMPRGYYNLIISIRDVKLYDKGLKPHRYWKISDVKKYFGVKGSANKIANQLDELKEICLNGDYEKFDV